MREMLTLLTILFLSFMLGCQDQSVESELRQYQDRSRIEQQNKDVVLRWYEAVDDGNVDAMLDLTRSDFRWYFPSNSENPTTKDNLRDVMNMYYAAFPKWTHRIDDIFAVEDKVVVRTVDITKHEGEFQGISPTGNEVEFGLIVIYRVEDGKIIESREEVDMVGFMSQIGMELKPSQ